MRLDTVQTSAASELLDLWERVVATRPDERADALLAIPPEPPPSSLGARNAALLELRARLFGSAQPLYSACPACGVSTEFTVDCFAMARELRPSADAAREHRLEVDGLRIAFRMPVAADVRVAAAAALDRGAFVRAMLERCVTGCERDDGTPCEPWAIPASVATALSERMEAIEPGASVGFDLTCPECGARWSAHMDCGDVLWSELQARVERLLLDVDTLARAYGWSEAQVLALSATRRTAYLQLIGSE